MKIHPAKITGKINSNTVTWMRPIDNPTRPEWANREGGTITVLAETGKSYKSTRQADGTWETQILPDCEHHIDGDGIAKHGTPIGITIEEVLAALRA